MTLRVGVVGLGVMGTDHVRTIATAVSGAEVAAVSDIDPARVGPVVAAHPGVRVHDDPYALIKDDAVDAVLVASSDPTHEEYVLACLDQAKPVLCEKPLAPTLAACRRVVDAEVATGRHLVSVGFMRRYDEGYRALRRALAGGDLGRPLLVHNVHRNPSAAPHLPSSMLVTGSAIHEIDITRWLLGEEITSVSRRAPRPSGLVVGDTQDPQLLLFETAGGVLVDVEIFANARYGYDVRCELVGERGVAAVEVSAPALVRSEGRASRDLPGDWRDRFALAYRRELQDWVDRLALGRTCAASAWDGLVATAVAEATVHAPSTGESLPVQLPPRPSFYD